MRQAATVLLLLTSVAPLGALAADNVPPADIRTAFGTGVPFTAVSTDGGKVYTMILKADGTAMMAARKSATPAIAGVWRISETGYCSRWGKGAEACFTVQKADASSYSVLDSKGAIVATWRK